MTGIPFKQGTILLHGAAAAIMAYGYNSLGNLPMDAWVQTQKGGRFQYITIQGLAMAWLTMVLSLTVDLFPSSIVIKKAKRALLITALPLTLAVSSMYWSLFFILPILNDQSTEPPSSPLIPLHIDFSLHLVPALALLADFILLEERLSEGEALYGAPIGVFLFTTWYGSWVEYCASFNGNYAYPLFTNNTLSIRIVTYIGVATYALVSFWIINFLHPKKSIR